IVTRGVRIVAEPRVPEIVPRIVAVRHGAEASVITAIARVGAVTSPSAIASAIAAAPAPLSGAFGRLRRGRCRGKLSLELVLYRAPAPLRRGKRGSRRLFRIQRLGLGRFRRLQMRCALHRARAPRRRISRSRGLFRVMHGSAHVILPRFFPISRLLLQARGRVAHAKTAHTPTRVSLRRKSVHPRSLSPRQEGREEEFFFPGETPRAGGASPERRLEPAGLPLRGGRKEKRSFSFLQYFESVLRHRNNFRPLVEFYAVEPFRGNTQDGAESRATHPKVGAGVELDTFADLHSSPNATDSFSLGDETCSHGFSSALDSTRALHATSTLRGCPHSCIPSSEVRTSSKLIPSSRGKKSFFLRSDRRVREPL